MVAIEFRLFVLSSGIFFTKYRSNTIAVLLGGTVALISSYFLFEGLVDRLLANKLVLDKIKVRLDDPFVHSYKMDSSVYAVAFSSDGRTVLYGCQKADMALLNLDTGNSLGMCSGVSSKEVRSVAFSPDGRELLAAGGSWIMHCDVLTGRENWLFGQGSRTHRLIAYSPDGTTALSDHNYDNDFVLWSVQKHDYEVIKILTGHTDRVNSIVFSPNGQTALSGSLDHTLKLWDIATGNEIRACKGHMLGVTSVVFSPDGLTALSGSLDKTSKLWDVATGTVIRTFTGHTAAILC
jgi:WD40 repeat protein